METKLDIVQRCGIDTKFFPIELEIFNEPVQYCRPVISIPPANPNCWKKTDEKKTDDIKPEKTYEIKPEKKTDEIKPKKVIKCSKDDLFSVLSMLEDAKIEGYSLEIIDSRKSENVIKPSNKIKTNMEPQHSEDIHLPNNDGVESTCPESWEDEC